MLPGISMRNSLWAGLAFGLSLTLCGCSRGSVNTSEKEGETQAQESDISITGTQAGLTPFIASVQLSGQSNSQVTSVTFTIAPMPNTVSKPVSVSWSRAALSSRGYLLGNLINLPVFGLYADYPNQVTIQIAFNDGSVQQLQSQISTQPYIDPTGFYMNPTIIHARSPGSTLGFNFFIIKSSLGSPVIADTDGNVRWVVPGIKDSFSSYFANGEFMIGSQGGPEFTLLQFDGSQSALPAQLPQPLLFEFTHNIDPSPDGVLAEFIGTDDLGPSIGDIVADIWPFFKKPPAQTFDMADILTAYMQANGDDASAFVRPGADWFHVNASTYDPSDNSVIVSSRENFLIKMNYSTRNIIWILGDPTKYWYTFPSLRAKALTLAPGGLYPVGQHAVSITSDGYVMVMNDGYWSLNQPPGAPQGVNRTYSEVSAYSVSTATMTAQQVWGFDYGQSILSQICGSSYEAPGDTYLVDFADAGGGTNARLIGLDPNHDVVFDFQYANVSRGDCDAAWNAIPIPLENLQIN
jgi:arylsulfate sulfotransferase